MNTTNKIELRCLIILLFFINSFIAWGLLTLLMIFNKITRNREITFWIILTVIFISLYNATKIPENDLEWYCDFYLMAGKTTLSNYLTQLTGNKEQLYQLLVYGLYQIGGNNKNFFIFSISAMAYGFLAKGIQLVCKELRLPPLKIMLVVFFLCFFPYTYAISVLIIRQFLALSIMLFLLAEYYCHERRKILIFFACCTIFIHSSVIILLPFFFLTQISRSINKRSAFLYIAILVLFLQLPLFSQLILPYIGVNPTIRHIIEKAIYGTTFETELPLGQLIFSLILVCLLYFSIYIKNKNLKKYASANYIANISIVILLFILINSQNPEIQLRYNFYFWSFLAFYFIIYLSAFKISDVSVLACMIMLFTSWNIYNIQFSEWTYTCSENYFFYPLFMYFL